MTTVTRGEAFAAAAETLFVIRSAFLLGSPERPGDQPVCRSLRQTDRPARRPPTPTQEPVQFRVLTPPFLSAQGAPEVRVAHALSSQVRLQPFQIGDPGGMLPSRPS